MTDSDPNTITFTRAPGERCWRLKSWTGITPDATLAVIEPEDCAIVNWHGKSRRSPDGAVVVADGQDAQPGGSRRD